MARAGARETGSVGPEGMIRSIYAARSAASGGSSAGDFARMKSADPDRSLRAAFLSRLSKSKQEAPREGGDLSQNVLRSAYVAHTIRGSR